jgi:hypothetical protein
MHEITKTYGLKSIKHKDYAYLSIDVLKNCVSDPIITDKYLHVNLPMDSLQMGRQKIG